MRTESSKFSLETLFGLVCGLVILVAASFKIEDATPAYQMVILFGLLEIGLATLLVCCAVLGRLHLISPFASLVFFSFAAYSAIAPQEPCRCFGNLGASKVIIIAFDLFSGFGFAIISLRSFLGERLGDSAYSRLFGISALLALLSVPLLFFSLELSNRDNGRLLDLASLINHELPLSHKDGAIMRLDGQWNLFLLSMDCDRCKTILAQFLARNGIVYNSDSCRGLLLAAEPVKVSNSENKPMLYYLLNSTKYAFRTPSKLLTRDSIVLDVKYFSP